MIAAGVIAIAMLIVAEKIGWWSYEPIFGSRLLICCVGVSLVTLTAFRPTFRSISGPQHLAISGLRVGIALLVVIFMLRPTLVTTKSTPQSAVLVIMFDQSRSMTLPHQSRDKSRWEVQLDTLRQNQAILRELAKNIEINIYGYDSQLHKIPFKDGTIELPKKPTGDQTDIGTPLSEAVKQEQGKRLAGVLFFGDGTITATQPEVEVWDAADELANLEYPLYTVALGSERAAEDARDVAVENLPDQYSVFVKNELLVRASVRVRGYVNEEVPVQLLVEDSQGEEKLVTTKRFTAREDDQQLEVEMAYVPQEAGQYRLIVRAADMPDEQVKKNNELSAFLTVLEGGLSVLYLEGDLRLEQKFLRRSIDASQDIELDFQWFDQRNRDRWPVDLAETFKNPQYDVFIIGDLDSRALYEPGVNEENLKALVDAVDRGKGLIMLGGYHSFGPGLYHRTPLADVLPIKMSGFEAQGFTEQISRDLHVNQPVRMLPATPHYLTRLGPAEDNESAWQSLPALRGANKFVGVKERVQILAEGQVMNERGVSLTPTGEKVPLLIAGEYGNGRVLALAGDSTWRWWMYGHQDEHKRFWRQIVLWLAKRDELEQNDVWIKLAQRRFNQGSRVEFTAGAKTAAGDPIRDAQFDATVILPDGQRKPIQLSSRAAEQIGQLDKFDTEQAGTYTIELNARTSRGQPLGTARAKFMVFDHDRELSNPAANPGQLADLALMTKGGKPLAPEEVSDLLMAIKRRPPELKIEIPYKWQLGDTLFDASLFMMCFLALIITEWVLRKLWGLV